MRVMMMEGGVEGGFEEGECWVGWIRVGDDKY